MKCAEFEDHLNQLLDQRRRPEWDAESRLHGEACAPCHELANTYGLLLEGFYALATPEPPVDLAVRVLDELRVRPTMSRRVSLVTAVLATAVAVLFAVVPLWQYATRRADDANEPQSASVALAADRPSEIVPLRWKEIDGLPVVGPVLISLSDDDETTDPYAELVKGTGQGLASVVLYIPRIGSSPGAISMAPNVINGEPGWPQRMTEGLKPVTESVSETLDLLLQALPVSSANRS